MIYLPSLSLYLSYSVSRAYSLSLSLSLSLYVSLYPTLRVSARELCARSAGGKRGEISSCVCICVYARRVPATRRAAMDWRDGSGGAARRSSGSSLARGGLAQAHRRRGRGRGAAASRRRRIGREIAARAFSNCA